MPAGTCDPASRGQTWNEGQLDTFGGDVSITYRYGWDGVSVRPDCVGPLNRLRAVNNSATVTYYAHFRGRHGTPRTIAMPPGFTQTYNAAQLHNAGFDDNTDLEDLQVTLSPDDPPPAR